MDGPADARDRARGAAWRPIGRRVGREHQISENLFLHLAGEAVGGRPVALWKEERTELAELRKRVRELERALGRKIYELEILGNGLRTWE